MTGQLDNQAYYDEFSGWYERDRSKGYHALIDALEMSVLGPVADGRRVLEAGCGTGLILERLARRASYAVGADLSAGMLAPARERGLNVVKASVTDLPFADGAFDVVCSFKVLAHVEAIKPALAELARVTRPGGRMVLEFYNPWSLRYLAKRIHPAQISDTTSESAVYTRWDSATTLLEYVPEGVRVDGYKGVRVFTPFAQVHRVPGLRTVVAAAERWAIDSPLRWFGGFLIAMMSKDD